MNNSIDINEVDKTKFKCFKFPDSSIYFGEIGYMDPITHAVLLEKDLNLLSEDKIKLLKIVRHGVGVQLFDVNDTESLCRYEGEWVKDKKNGRGNCYFSDNSVYEGSFVNDLFEGHGKYSWPNNDIYIGIWKAGRMEGEGEFKHSDGHILKGMFKNNYYFDKERFSNPFLSLDELELFKAKNSEYLAKIKAQNEKFSRSSIIKISTQQELISSIEETIKNNKTPLILRSRESLIKKHDIFNLLVKEYREFDLRNFFIKLRESLLNNTEIYDDINKLVVEAMTKGLFLILNFDDCATRYTELFDPDIKEFHGKLMLSPFLWTPNLFSQPKCWQSHLNTKKTELKLDKNFKFVVYSKFLIDPDMQEHDMINEIEKRFEKCFSLLNVNVIILSDFKN